MCYSRKEKWIWFWDDFGMSSARPLWSSVEVTTKLTEIQWSLCWSSRINLARSAVFSFQFPLNEWVSQWVKDLVCTRMHHLNEWLDESTLTYVKHETNKQMMAEHWTGRRIESLRQSSESCRELNQGWETVTGTREVWRVPNASFDCSCYGVSLNVAQGLKRPTDFSDLTVYPVGSGTVGIWGLFGTEPALSRWGNEVSVWTSEMPICHTPSAPDKHAFTTHK